MKNIIIATLAATAALTACSTKMSPVTLVSDEANAAVDAPTIVAQLATLDIKATVVRASGSEIALTVSDPARVRSLASDLLRPRRLIIAPFAEDQSPLTSLSEAEAASNTRTDHLLGKDQTPMPAWDDAGALTAFVQRLEPEVVARVIIGRYSPLLTHESRLGRAGSPICSRRRTASTTGTSRGPRS